VSEEVKYSSVPSARYDEQERLTRTTDCPPTLMKQADVISDVGGLPGFYHIVGILRVLDWGTVPKIRNLPSKADRKLNTESLSNLDRK